MQTRGKTSMARKYTSRQAETKSSNENVPINSSNTQAIKQIKQSNKSSKRADQANKQIKQTNRSSRQTERAIKQIKQTNRSNKQADQAANKSPQEAFKYLALSKPSRQVEIKRTSGNQASDEYRTNKIEQRI
jgi:hypothetical protein